MIILRSGDRLPTVAIVQNMINEFGHSPSYCAVDGIFGRLTQQAVREFQSAERMAPTGIVRYPEWRKLVGPRWQIVESIDLSDWDDPKYAIDDDKDLQPYSSMILRNYGQSQGARTVIATLLQQANSGNLLLLRFHGHGSPGSMVVSEGVHHSQASSFSHYYKSAFDEALQKLRSAFPPYGSVEMHGCRVALGQKGLNLLTRMANALNVPVTAGLGTQYGGGQTTYRFEGRTRTICPGGQSLKEWARNCCQVSLTPV